VTVFPRIYETISPVGAGVESLSGGRLRGGLRVNSGTHFAGVRGWQPGDSLKQVDWKTTARREQLMVKSFEEELGGRLSILLDAAPAAVELVDNAVRAAGSLGASALQEGHHVEFIGIDAEGHLRLPPFSDERELLERLARYSPPPAPPVLRLDSLSRKSAIALVGTEWRGAWSEFIEQAHQQNRPVHVYLPAGQEIPFRDQAALAGIWEFDAAGINNKSAAETNQ
jgi:uncharacterized protein (DUF58 family)